MLKKLSKAIIASALMTPMAASMPAQAAAEYCHTDVDGDYVCIHAVYGNRSNRGITVSINGRIHNVRVNCYNPNYQSTSLVAYACWSYEAINSETSLPEPSEKSESLVGIMSGSGFLPEGKAIDLDEVMNAMPPEMK